MSIATREEVAAGRPRDPRIEQAVLNATAVLLVRHGYADLNLAEVARRARTTKPAIYRRWRSKAHLVHEAAAELGGATELDKGPVAEEPVADAEVEEQIRLDLAEPAEEL